MSYDAILVASFGGPEGPDEVMPFLENVARGRNIPRARLEAVAGHYHHFGGVSPINARTRELIDALRAELAVHGPELPIYWGNRFSVPRLPDTVREMRDAGVTRALAFATSAFSSFSSCRAYLTELERARDEVEGAPVIDKLPPFWDEPGYLETCVERLRDVLPDASATVLFSAHSIPVAMSEGCEYAAQLETLSTRIAGALDIGRWRLVYQSRSGPPRVPWLEPDVCDALADLERGSTVVVAPIGFVADHMEVVFDLEVEARAHAEELGLRFLRALAANAHPRFVRMIRERLARAVREGVTPCAPGCCPSGRP